MKHLPHFKIVSDVFLFRGLCKSRGISHSQPQFQVNGFNLMRTAGQGERCMKDTVHHPFTPRFTQVLQEASR